jgi:pyruvate dehydrogenase E1 component beta subunit
MARLRMIHAINNALREEMERDPRIVLFGEDVGISVMGDTRGLRAKFGAERVRDTPVSEAALTGMAVGAAAAGRRVICHLMYANFFYTGFDAIANQAAKLRLMTNGQIRLPIVYMAVSGGGRSSAAQHSDSPHPALMNLGGITVVAPGSSADAKGLLKSAIRSDGPVVFLQPASRGGEMGDVPDEEYLVPLGSASIVRPGRDVTIVAIGSMVRPSLKAAEALAADGIEAEVVDPRTLHPLDKPAILASVRRTGRLVVADEARDTCSAASHIAAIAADEMFHALVAPVRRVTAADLPLAYAPSLERTQIPDADRIAAVATAVVRGPQRSR